MPAGHYAFKSKAQLSVAPLLRQPAVEAVGAPEGARHTGWEGCPLPPSAEAQGRAGSEEPAVINPEDWEPDADALDGYTLPELAELSDRDHDVAKVLIEWQSERGSSPHGVGTFLELLAAAGYRVEKIEVPDIEPLLPPPSE